MKKSDLGFLNQICRYPAIDWITDNHDQVLKKGISEVAKLVAETLEHVKSIIGKDTDVAKAVDRMAKDIRLSSYERFPDAADKTADTASCIALAVSAWLIEKLPSVRSTDIAMNLFGRAADIDSAYYDSHDFMSILEDYDDEAETFINDFMNSDEEAFGEEIKEEDDFPKETYTNKYNNNFATGSNNIILQDAKIKIDKIEANGLGDLNSKLREKVKEATDKKRDDKLTPPPPAKPLTKDERIRHAFEVIVNEGLLKHKGDLALIKKAMEEKPIEMFFTLDEFIAYLKELQKNGLCIDSIPAKTTISRLLGKIGEKGTDGFYTFSDNCGRNEAQRRNNVMKRFLSAFNDIPKSTVAN